MMPMWTRRAWLMPMFIHSGLPLDYSKSLSPVVQVSPGEQPSAVGAAGPVYAARYSPHVTFIANRKRSWRANRARIFFHGRDLLLSQRMPRWDFSPPPIVAEAAVHGT